jgi:DNA-binding IclR family transcriptional regulator
LDGSDYKANPSAAKCQSFKAMLSISLAETDGNDYGTKLHSTIPLMSVAAVKKAFVLLECLARTGKPLPLRELAEEAGLPKPTAYRLLQTLRSIGYLAQEAESGSYLLTDGVHRLVPSHPYAMLRMKARPWMEHLHGHFNETVNLGVLEGENVRYVDFIETTNALRLVSRPGEVDPAYSTALGRAILASLPEDEVEHLIRRSEVKRRTNRTLTDCGGLLAVISQTRSKGWAEETEENNRGVCCLAVSLSSQGFPYAAISVTVPKARLDGETRKGILNELRRIQSGKSI